LTSWKSPLCLIGFLSAICWSLPNYIRSSPLNPSFAVTAPPGFLLLNKLLVGIWGNEEYVLRFQSFLWGVLSVLLFNLVTRDGFDYVSRLLANGLFAICPLLIYYWAIRLTALPPIYRIWGSWKIIQRL
jgi:hypothetical protein